MTLPLDRRQFLRLTGSAAFAAPFMGSSAFSAETSESLYRKVIPTRKDLDVAWAASLSQRGSKLDAAIQSSTKEDLERIGMTVGGIGCGTVYLSGDGRLYVWDIFHQPHEGVVVNKTDIPKGLQGLKGQKIAKERDGANYIKPPTVTNQPNPFKQGFSMSLDGQPVRSLDNAGWKSVRFTGRWPLGTVDYVDPGAPVRVQLNAWSPFIPLETADSSLPVTVMGYTIHNTGQKAISGKLTGIWENPVLIHSRKKGEHAVSSRVDSTKQLTSITHHAATNEPMPVGDWGTATLATIGESTATETKDGLVRSFSIEPGASTTISFLLCWHFPNIPKLDRLGPQKPQYAVRFASSTDVATYVGQNFDKLKDATLAWVKTWNDSTLPQWLLDRSILTTNTLQTTTCEILAGKDYPDGRFWAWEGIGCCPGTCAHVWHYAQGVARLFPSLERNLREITDYKIGLNPDGSIRFRAESSKTIAIDSQTGIILRTWREHLLTQDKQFLTRIWPAAQKALQWLIDFDGKGRGGLDGLLDGEQHNTLDAEWYGKVHCLCSLYLASLRAGQEMALAMDDTKFAEQCASIHATGAEKIATLFNGEFYIQEEDPTKLKAIGVGTGCYIDQVIGQWWANQIGLGRIYSAKNIHSALDSLWKYNFVTEIGTFRQSFDMGRHYAMAGEAGLVMCTWPKGGLRDDFKNHWQYGYFNECMSGFEWQVAAHMMQEGPVIDDKDTQKAASILDDPSNPKSMTLRGLAIGRAVHDRYHASKRNPYNEIECSDHYARANASYSVFLAACGFEYDGPKGIIGFTPKLNPSLFKSAFTAAAGWGSFEQKLVDDTWNAKLRLQYGELKLSEIKLPWINSKAMVRVGKDAVDATIENGVVRFKQPITLKAGADELTITC